MPSFSFRLGAIPVRVELTFFAIILFLGLAQPGIFLPGWVAAAFVSILVPELGHAVTGRLFGQTPRIVLHGLGGLTYGAGGRLRPWQNAVVSLAGSTTEIVVLGLPAVLLLRSDVLLGADGRLSASVLYLAFVSIVWGVFNLVPVLPLDGGNIAMVLLTRLSPRYGPTITYGLGGTIAGAGAAWGFANRQFLVGLMGGLFAVQNFSAIRQSRDEPLQRRVAEANRALDRGDHGEASRTAEQVLQGARSGPVRAAAAETLSWAFLMEGRLGAATRAIEQMGTAEPPPPLRGALAVEAGRVDEGVDLVVDGILASEQGPPNLALARVLARRDVAVRTVNRLLEAEGGAGLPWAATLFVHLHRIGEYEQAADAGKRLFDDGRTDRGALAYKIAGSLARAGRTAEGLEWLDRAVAAGFADLGQMDGDPDLESLRGSEPFVRIRARMSGPGH